MQITLPQSGKPLAVWEKIEIIVGSEENAGHYVARIEDFINEGIIVSNPEFISGATRLREGCDVHGLVTRDDAVYQFSSKVRKFSVQGAPLFLLANPQNFRRVQRRQFVRLEISKEVTFASVKAKRSAVYKPSELTWQKTRMINISGGGLLVRVSDQLDKNAVILLKSNLFFEIGLPVTIAAEVRCVRKDNDVFQCGFEFIRRDRIADYFSMSERRSLPESIQFFDLVAQNKLVTYVFQQQVEMRQKGLL